jgi:hypothetical protein
MEAQSGWFALWGLVVRVCSRLTKSQGASIIVKDVPKGAVIELKIDTRELPT